MLAHSLKNLYVFLMNLIPEKYREAVQNFFEVVKTNAESSQMLIPVVIFFNTKDGTQVPMIAAFQNDEQKLAFATIIKEVSKKFKPDLVVSAFESYVVKNPSGKLRTGEIKDYPDAYEVILVSVETRNGSWACSLPISKDRKLSIPDQLFVESKMEGLFSNIIHLKTVLH